MSLRTYVEHIAVQAASDAIKAGTFDREIEGIVIATIRDGKDTGLTEIGFILKMAVEAMRCAMPPISFTRSKQISRQVYDQFLADNPGVKFDDPDWDWSGSAARDLVHEYEIDHWERAA